VVFILSDESAASEVCCWEVEKAQRLAERMLVVTLGDVSPGPSPPPALAGIDWIHCWENPKVPGSNLIRGVIELDADPDHPDLFLSPCRPHLDAAAFDPATAADARTRLHRKPGGISP
jgi:hypothetical protein